MFGSGGNEYRGGPHMRGWRAIVAAACATLLCGGAALALEVEVNDDRALALKLDGYVGCLNRHGNWVLQSRDRYLSWLKSPEKGPSGRESVVYGLYRFYDTADCARAIDAAAALPPSSPPLEGMAARWKQALLGAEGVVAEAADYYELENYKDDRMARGKALHPRLMAAFAEFDAAHDDFHATVVGAQDGIAARRLQRLAADPALRVEYLAERLLMDAKRVLRSAEGIGSKGFALAPYSEAVATLEASWRALGDYRKANPDDRRDVVRSSSYVDAAFALLKTAKTAERRARDGFRFDDGETMLIEANAAQMVDGHPVQLVQKYNDFIGVANRTRW